MASKLGGSLNFSSRAKIALWLALVAVGVCGRLWQCVAGHGIVWQAMAVCGPGPGVYSYSIQNSALDRLLEAAG